MTSSRELILDNVSTGDEGCGVCDFTAKTNTKTALYLYPEPTLIS